MGDTAFDAEADNLEVGSNWGGGKERATRKRVRKVEGRDRDTFFWNLGADFHLSGEWE